MFEIGRALLLSLVLTSGVVACSSPEATRMRAGGPGADPGNRGKRVVMHEGSQPYYRTPRLTDVPGPALAPASQARAVETGRP